MKDVLLFTYGTLMKGKPNDHFMYLAKYVGDAHAINMKMYDCGAFPLITKSEGSSVLGELWRVPEYVMESIDRLEGCTDNNPGLYEKLKIDVVLESGTKWKAIAYVATKRAGIYRYVKPEFERKDLGANRKWSKLTASQGRY